MRKISLGTVSLTADSFGSTEQMDGNPLTPKPARSRLKLRHLRLLLLSACAVAATACASLQPADHTDPAMAAAQAEADQAMAQAKEAMAAAEAAAAAQDAAEATAATAMQEAEMARSEADAATKDAEMARSEAGDAMKDAEMARSEAGDAMKDAEMARSEADSASDKLMMATAPHPAEVMVSADQFDASLLDMSGGARLAGRAGCDLRVVDHVRRAALFGSARVLRRHHRHRGEHLRRSRQDDPRCRRPEPNQADLQGSRQTGGG